MLKKKIFVTVGTTKFDELINTVTESDVLEELNKKKYNHITLQIGRSTLSPNCTLRNGFSCIEFFKLSPNIKDYVESADLIISHAGAGSCLEALQAHKPLIVVTNESLMDNHQLELAEQLCKDGHLYYCTCKTLLDLIRNIDFTKLKPFANNKSKNIAQLIDRIMGFQ